jgi:predicted alpha/beta superfamily hydrolase
MALSGQTSENEAVMPKGRPMRETLWEPHTLPAEKPALARRRHAPHARRALDPMAIAEATDALAAEGASITGTVWVHPEVPSAFLDAPRDVWVYLPPGYDPDGDSRYPVLYMHDGENLFSAGAAFGGQEWGMDETAEWLIAEGELPPVIIVGIANTEDRLEEYTWIKDEDGDGGQGRRYARFMVEELKPFVDMVYRTLPQPRFTGVMGSSLGALHALYLGRYRSRVFGRIGAMSPSLWWADRQALADLAGMPPGLRIWLDVGSEEGEDDEESADVLEDARDLVDILCERGNTPGTDLYFLEDDGAGHDEAAWGERVSLALRFLFAWHSLRIHRHRAA